MGAIRFKVGDDGEGVRLDVYVSLHAEMTRAAAQRLIAEGRVTVDGITARKRHLLRAGELVEFTVPDPSPPGPRAQEIPIRVLYQDADLAVVCKPAGMVVHPAAGHHEGTLVNALLFALDGLSGVGGVSRPGIVHRLDKDTSGLMVVAKNDRSHHLLQGMIKDRSLRRFYLVLVHGVPATDMGTVAAPVGRDARNRKRMAVTSASGREAVTHFKVLRDFGRASLLEAELQTGRTHQIRVHMAYIGHPVAGDREYGRPGSLEAELGLKRQFLHAWKLSFEHPLTGEVLVFEEPLPEDLKLAIDRLASISETTRHSR
ncbi:MAG: RluA family pseudouridine synthase [Actinobacteria bacterium]|nr:RluA family pseudouridine synthase [Actinomycetota bacterium]